MIGILLTVLGGGPRVPDPRRDHRLGIVAIIGAILVLIAGIPSGGFGFGNRWGGSSRSY